MFLWLLILAIIPIVIFFRTKSTPAPRVLVPLGTNAVAPGTAFCNSLKSEGRIGTILESDNAYEFPDGTIEPAHLVKSKVTGSVIWVPQEWMMNVLIEQR